MSQSQKTVYNHAKQLYLMPIYSSIHGENSKQLKCLLNQFITEEKIQDQIDSNMPIVKVNKNIQKIQINSLACQHFQQYLHQDQNELAQITHYNQQSSLLNLAEKESKQPSLDKICNQKLFNSENPFQKYNFKSQLPITIFHELNFSHRTNQIIEKNIYDQTNKQLNLNLFQKESSIQTLLTYIELEEKKLISQIKNSLRKTNRIFEIYFQDQIYRKMRKNDFLENKIKLEQIIKKTNELLEILLKFFIHKKQFFPGQQKGQQKESPNKVEQKCFVEKQTQQKIQQQQFNLEEERQIVKNLIIKNELLTNNMKQEEISYLSKNSRNKDMQYFKMKKPSSNLNLFLEKIRRKIFQVEQFSILKINHLSSLSRNKEQYVILISQSINEITLETRIKNKSIKFLQFIEVMLKTALIIESLHKKNLKHLNITSKNIYCLQDKSIKINFPMPDDLLRNIHDHREQRYISPENCENNILSFSCDIWSLGIILLQYFCEKDLSRIKNGEQKINCLKSVKNEKIYHIIEKMVAFQVEERSQIEYIVSYLKGINNYQKNFLKSLQKNNIRQQNDLEDEISIHLSKNNQRFPFNCIGLIYCIKPDRATFGTGFLIAKNIVITCAHVFRDQFKLKNIKKVYFFIQNRKIKVKTWSTCKSFQQNFDQVSSQDLGLAVLEENVQLQEYLQFLINIGEKSSIKLSGFKMIDRELKLYCQQTLAISIEGIIENFIFLKEFGSVGQSGAPILYLFNNSYYVIALYIGKLPSSSQGCAIKFTNKQILFFKEAITSLTQEIFSIQYLSWQQVISSVLNKEEQENIYLSTQGSIVEQTQFQQNYLFLFDSPPSSIKQGESDTMGVQFQQSSLAYLERFTFIADDLTLDNTNQEQLLEISSHSVFSSQILQKDNISDNQSQHSIYHLIKNQKKQITILSPKQIIKLKELKDQLLKLQTNQYEELMIYLKIFVDFFENSYNTKDQYQSKFTKEIKIVSFLIKQQEVSLQCFHQNLISLPTKNEQKPKTSMSFSKEQILQIV